MYVPAGFVVVEQVRNGQICGGVRWMLLQDSVTASWAQVSTTMLPENGAAVQANTIAGATR